MDSNTLSALAAVLSVVAVLITALISYRQSKLSRLERAEDLATRFRDPLLQAAYNLQSRLYNIAKQNLLGRLVTAPGASQQERDYALHNTCFVFAEYLAWVEIIRRESQYIDPRSRENNRLIAHQLETVRDIMASSERFEDRELRIFRGDQRALGELMLVAVSQSTEGVPRWECLGYAAFVERLTNDPKFGEWFAPLLQGIETLAKEAPHLPARGIELQHALVELMDVLDPHSHRIPSDIRGKM
jgi:hypothetical protein